MFDGQRLTVDDLLKGANVGDLGNGESGNERLQKGFLGHSEINMWLNGALIRYFF